MSNGEDRDILADAELAGEQYANDQITGSDYFMDWVRSQLLEASRLDPSTVLPLETKADARVIAKNMLQQLEWDTKRDLQPREIASLIGVDDTTHEDVKEFFKGFSDTLRMNDAWLADELLEIQRGMRGGEGVEEVDRRRGPRGGRLTRSTAKPGTAVRVADSDSMYRGWTGTVVEPRTDRVARLDDYNKRFLKGEGTVLVETPRGELFVIHARALERLGEAVTRAMDRDSRVREAIHGYNIEVFFSDEHLARKFERQISDALQLPLVAQGALRDGYRLEYGPINGEDYIELERLIYSKVGNAGRVRLVQLMYGGGGAGVQEASRRSGSQPRYRPAKTWRLRVVDRVIPSHDGHRVEFQDGFSIQVHGGSGRDDLLYAMRPSDMRHERREPGPTSRKEYQYAALLAVLGDRQAEFVVDRDDDVRAILTPGGA